METSALPVAAMRHQHVVELRRYKLHTGRREALIELFDRELVEPQEDCGMAVLGQFRDHGQPDHFVWLRGFADMEARRDGLTQFYGGPVWDAHKDAANATMISSDDVLLLRPAWEDAGFDLTGHNRAPVAAIQSVPATAWLTTTHYVRPADEQAFVDLFHKKAAPLLSALGAEIAGAFVTEHAENNFSRLPVRAEENVFVWFSRLASTAALDKVRDAQHHSQEWSELAMKLEGLCTRAAETSGLQPTARSLLA
ncbi:NIPSNAP family protein [Mesorhizobium sp. NBSH29]|uniref:NIPSNAP family protein n=1 Tax=Mesorhizobium sp. NBSH29 TaxID=2654249 RepID=UPI001896747A|nr:NIPSNAP family protein [Mesorhizobium sp. NBSH29]QPC86842.1 NIPSNAP family protein [Mesorhizobium sp. NBSH29]